MKPFERIAYITAILAIGIIWKIEHTTNQGNEKAREAEYKAKIREKEEDEDRLNKVLKLKDDTIRIAKHTIITQSDSINTFKSDKSNYKKNTHDKIRFIGFTTDAKRDSMLTKLYPSFRPF